MTRIKNNALLKGISGKMGETHVYRKVRGKMHMVNLPETGRPVTEKQKLFNERFAKATNYAKEQMKDLLVKEEYRTGITAKKHNPYLVAVSDSLNAPKVHGIKAVDYQGAIGEVITIDATDDFKVVRVRVVIRGRDGAKLEQGNALQDTKNIKEIGVRKVLGATVIGLVSLLSRDFLKLVLIASCIAFPIAWWTTNRWLQEYAYHIELEWWVFVLAGALATGIALLTISYRAIKTAVANPVKSLRSE